ncbi:MAG: hypothetical protein P1U58_20130 [Verrucomicrobiales bacterium]|nr:hypothetical protein [Verrucomicrobiales bacterium]
MRVRYQRAQCGAALITTLVIVSAIALIVVGVFSVSRQEAITTGSILSKTRAKLASEAAIADAVSLLRSLTANDHYVVTTATEGSGTDLTRFYFISQPYSEDLLHIPLFSGGAVHEAEMPKMTGSLAAISDEAPSIQWASRRDADNRISLSPLTQLSANGVPFEENPLPKIGFIELDTSISNPGGRAKEIRSRYAYWIEDLEGFPSLDVAEAPTPHFPASDSGIEDQSRGGYSRFDSRTQPGNPGDVGLRLAFADDPRIFYQFPKAVRGQSRLDQVAPGLSPGDQPFLPWKITGMDSTAHPFASFSSRALKPFVPSGSRATSDRFVSGLVPYLSRPMIPFGHEYAEEGQPKYNINRLVADGDMTVASIIYKNLPNFEQRKGGFPLNPVDPSFPDYTATIAASIIDYADADSLPSTPLSTVNSADLVFRGVDSYCPVNEFFVDFEYMGFDRSPDYFDINFKATIYAEFWNPSNQTATLTNATIHFEFLEPITFLSNSERTEIDSNPREKDEPKDTPQTFTVPPNGYVVKNFGEIEWKVQIPRGPFEFPVVQDIREKNSSSTRAYYELRLNGEPVDSSGRMSEPANIDYGFFFERYQYQLERNDSFMRMAIHALAPRGYGVNGGFGAHLGDPWMSFYSASTSEGSTYTRKASPGYRNVDLDKVNSNRFDLFKDQTRVRDWPDRGYDTPVGPTPSADDEKPIEFETPPDESLSRFAPWRISNLGRYHSVSEFGNIHDPVMWVYGPSAGPDSVIAKQTKQFYTSRVPNSSGEQNPWLKSIPLDAEPKQTWGGGNTLRIGRPEHDRFDLPGMRASQLLDLFHVGVPGNNLNSVESAKTPMLYENFDPKLHRLPPTADDPDESVLEPFSSLYSMDEHARSPFQSQWGKLNLNTAPTLFEFEALLRGPIVSSDIVVDAATANEPVTPDYTDESTLGELTKRLDPDAIPAIALGLYEARPFYSQSHLARVFTELIEEHDALPEHYNDAEAEETFARLLNTTSLSSRHFRIHTYAENYVAAGTELKEDVILARDRKAYDVFIEPIRDSNGEIESTKLRMLRVIIP